MSTVSSHRQKQFGLPVKIGFSLLLVAAMGAGVYLTLRGIRSVEESLASTSWPTTNGTITQSHVKLTETPVKKNGRVVPNKRKKSYSPNITYTYTVKEHEYVGTRVTVDDESVGTVDSSKSIVDRYPAHKQVTVSYHPDDPSRSLLEPGGWAGSYRWFTPGGFLLLVPLLLFRAIWFYEPTVHPADVTHDENHPLRPKLLNGMLMVEEIVTWEPQQLIHLRRARVGFIRVIAGAIITGLILGTVVGLLPAIFLLSGRGIVFIGQFYLAVSALLAVGVAVGLMLWGRRREYMFDWALGTLHAEIGWRSADHSLESAESLILSLPAPDAPRNPVVDSHTIQIKIDGRAYTLLETNGSELSWGETRERLTQVTRQLSDALGIPWGEVQEKSTQRNGFSS